MLRLRFGALRFAFWRFALCAHKHCKNASKHATSCPPPPQQQTTNNKQKQQTSLDEQIRKCDEQLCKFREQLKKTRPGPAQEALKRRAMTVLRQKKMFEGQRETLYNQQFNMEQTRFAVESVQDTVQTVQALKGAAKEMRGAMKANKELDLAFIDKLQDELADMADVTAEVNEALGQSFAVPEDVDEADLMAELDALDAEMAAEPAVGEGGVPSYLQEPADLPELPSAPQAAMGEEEPVAQRT
jgi:charged multivesicular body protein 5